MSNIEQVYNLTNQAIKEAIGDEIILEEDLSNVIEVGKTIENAKAYDKYVGSLINLIGKIVFAGDRKYQAFLPSVMRDGWEFGSILEKINIGMPEATTNQSWELHDGQAYDNGQIFYAPKVTATFFNRKTTFEIKMSIALKQVKESFNSATSLGGFVSAIFLKVSNAMEMRISNLVKETINSLICDTIYDDFGSETLSSKSGVKAINLLKLYNTQFGTTLTADKAITDKDFIRFSVFILKDYIDRLKEPSTLYNKAGELRFTPKEMLNCVMLSMFKNSADTYLQSDTFHNEYTALPNAETVTAWQGVKQEGSVDTFADRSKIMIKTANGYEVTATGVIAVLFDHDALAVCNEDRRTVSVPNIPNEFYTEYFKYDCSYYQANDENAVVFFVA